MGSIRSKTLFHLHTTFTDGRATLEDYFVFARENGVRRLVFLEHIREKPTFDVYAFVRDVAYYSKRYGVMGVVGFEAKILPGGRLDISEQHIQMAQYIGIAEHSFPADPDMLAESFRILCEAYSSKYPRVKYVWVHPGLWFKKHELLDHPAYDEMLQSAIKAPILIEYNLKYRLPESSILNRLPRSKIILGLDAHSLDEIRSRR